MQRLPRGRDRLTSSALPSNALARYGGLTAQGATLPRTDPCAVPPPCLPEGKHRRAKSAPPQHATFPTEANLTYSAAHNDRFPTDPTTWAVLLLAVLLAHILTDAQAATVAVLLPAITQLLPPEKRW